MKYFVLRGDNEHLAEGELKALLEAYGQKASLDCYTMICLCDVGNQVASKVVRRAGFIKEAGTLLGVYDAYSVEDAREVARVLGDSPVHVSVYKSTVEERAVREFLEVAGIGQRTRGIGEKRLIFSSGLVFLGVKEYVQDTKSMLHRAKCKPFKRSIALNPDIARALVNLTRAKEGSLLLDPFAGTGSVLIEAWEMGIRGIGVDIDWKLVKGMVTNIKYFNVGVIALLGDSRHLVYREVDHVATDLPYGRGASTHGVEIRELYRAFAERLSEYLSKRGYASFITPLWLEDFVDELLSSCGLRLAGRYYDYVHSSLTRVINVVKW